MTDAYRVGAVWWAMFDFKDGAGETRKYFVLLNDLTQPGSLAVAALTTSRGAQIYPRHVTSACGCPDYPFFRIESKQEDCFPITTWVEFNNTYLVPRSKLDSMQQNKKAGYLQLLAPDRIRAVLNCATKSLDLPLKNVEMVKQTLKAMNTPKAKPAPPTPPPPLSPMAKLKARFDSHEKGCQNKIQGIIGKPINELVGVLSGKTPEPPAFMADADAAFELIVPECQCPNAK